jgi:hypothetical protein
LRRTEVVVVVVWQLRPFSLGGCAIAIVCRVEQVRKVLEGGGSTEVMGLRALYHRMLGLGYVALLCAGPPEGREGQGIGDGPVGTIRQNRGNRGCEPMMVMVMRMKFPRTVLVEIIAIDDNHQSRGF